MCSSIGDDADAQDNWPTAEDPYSLHNAFHDITTGSYGDLSNLDRNSAFLFAWIPSIIPTLACTISFQFLVRNTTLVSDWHGTNTGLADGKMQLTWTNGEEDGKDFHQG